MKKKIHPKLNKVTIQMTNGETFTTLSTYNKGDTIVLDLDKHNHPAWTGVDKGAMENIGSVAKHRERFGSFNLLGDDKKD